MTQRTKKRKLPVLAALAIAIMIGFIPQMVVPAYADDGTSAIQLVTDGNAANINGAQASSVWFGNYLQSSDGKGGYNNEPIKWRVLQNSDKKLFLLSDMNLDNEKYNHWNISVTWEDSDIRRWLNNDFKATAFSVGEASAVMETDVINDDNPEYGTPGGKDTKDNVFFLSIGEATDTQYGFTDNYSETITREAKNTDYADSRGAFTESGWHDGNGTWLLRSPGFHGTATAGVYSTGSIEFDYGVIFATAGIRPAFNLDLEDVLFTSTAEGSISQDAEGALMKVGKNVSGEWKMTLKDNKHAGFTVLKTTQVEKGVSIEYTGAATGTNEYISAIITDKPITEADAIVTHYGRIAKASASDDASVTINTADKLGEDDHLYVFNEKYNGDKKTDYASELKEVNVSELITYTVTFKVKNGSWNDGKAADRKVILYRYVNEDKALVLQSEDIPSVGSKPANGYKAGNWDIAPDTETVVTTDTTYTYTYAKKADSAPTPTRISGTLLAKLTAKGSRDLVLTWNKVNGAVGYDIFFSSCGKRALKKVKTIKGNKTFKWTKKRLKKKTAYKAVVKAYMMKDGKKTYVRTSPMVHAYTTGGTKNNTNSKSVTVKKTNVLLKNGKTFKIKATVNKLQKGKKLMQKGHAPKLRYISSNKKIATVSKAGKITAMSKGSCKVYVIAVNGASKAVSVKVK